MTDDSNTSDVPVDWGARVKRLLNEHVRLAAFVASRENDGTITPEAANAFFAAAVAVQTRAGDLGDLVSAQRTPDATFCAVVAHALAEGRRTLISHHPELEAQLKIEVPETNAGRRGP